MDAGAFQSVCRTVEAAARGDAAALGDLRREAGLLARFGGAGVANTIVGLAVVMTLDVGLGVDRQLANAASYLAGGLLSFFLQKRFVFRQGEGGAPARARFLAAMLFAFGINQMVLVASGGLLPPDRAGRAVAQLIAMASYTATQFLLFRLWVFRPRASEVATCPRRSSR